MTRLMGKVSHTMHMSLASASNPFHASTFWKANLNGRGHVLFLHLGDDMTLLMSPEEVGTLTTVLLQAIEDTPLPAHDDSVSAHSR